MKSNNTAISPVCLRDWHLSIIILPGSLQKKPPHDTSVIFHNHYEVTIFFTPFRHVGPIPSDHNLPRGLGLDHRLRPGNRIRHHLQPDSLLIGQILDISSVYFVVVMLLDTDICFISYVQAFSNIGKFEHSIATYLCRNQLINLDSQGNIQNSCDLDQFIPCS